MHVDKVLIDVMIFNLLAVFLTKLGRRALMNQQTVPAGVSRAEVVGHWCVSDVKALLGLQVFQFTLLHRDLENLFVWLLDAGLVRPKHKVKVVIELHVPEKNIQSRVKVADDAELEVRLVLSILPAKLLLQFQIIHEVHCAVSQLPTRRCFVQIQQIRCHVVYFIVRQLMSVECA